MPNLLDSSYALIFYAIKGKITSCQNIPIILNKKVAGFDTTADNDPMERARFDLLVGRAVAKNDMRALGKVFEFVQRYVKN